VSKTERGAVGFWESLQKFLLVGIPFENKIGETVSMAVIKEVAPGNNNVNASFVIIWKRPLFLGALIKHLQLQHSTLCSRVSDLLKSV
jgi:hypothetical protein